MRVAAKPKTRLKFPNQNLGFPMEMGTNEIVLPEEIIQHIQSYMTAKEAARTLIISKSWHASWLTRPNLDFDQRNFGWQRFGHHAQDIFWLLVKKTTQRYDELNLRIQSFSLCISYGKDNCSHAEKLIVRAIKLGATDINFEVEGGGLSISGFGMGLPQEVLGSETLRKLSVRGCKIGLGEDRKPRCSRLELLSLKNFLYTDGDVIWDIILNCPSIENLSLSGCKLENSAELQGSWLFEKLCGSAVHGLISPFYKLKSLFLEKVPIGPSFFHDFGSKFPCLKDLSVHKCDRAHGRQRIRFGEIKIASSSLESISFVQNTKLKAKFDVPCIRKFMFQGTSLPFLSFENYSRGWKSDISVIVNLHCATWFPRLKKLLANLSQEEICLSLKILNFKDKSSDNGRDDGLPPVAVKDLMLYLEVPSSITSSFLNGLFWSCRPKFITLHLFPCGIRGNYDFLMLLFNTVKHHELRAGNFEVFYDMPAEWRPAPLLKPLFEAAVSPKFRGKIRFQLR